VPAFTLAFAHGVFSGSDTNRTWMVVMYAVTGMTVLFLIFVRALTYGYRPPRATPPQRAERPVAVARQTTEAAAPRTPVKAPEAVRAPRAESPGFHDAIKGMPQP
jgi:uncharacterized iron-regulated membrane protein